MAIRHHRGHGCDLRRALRISGLLTALICLLVSCGAPPGASGEGGKQGEAGKGGRAPAGYPKTLGNCGRKVTVERPPERVASLDQASTEILLSLGLGHRIAGTAKWTDPVLPGLRKANAKIPRIADFVPSSERVLAAEPDLVTASFTATLDKGGVAPRGDFEKLGVPTYVSPADCTGKTMAGGGDGSRTKPLTTDAIRGEIRDLAKIFDVERRGEKLVAEMDARAKKATERARTEGGKGARASDPKLMFWFANSESPYLAGCCGAPGIIADAVGAENAFEDSREEWPQIGWEQVADRDPDVIVLGDLTRKSQTAETARQKIAFLESNPVTRELDAVKHKRYVLLSGAAMNPSIRTSTEGVEKVAAGLRKFGLDR